MRSGQFLLLRRDNDLSSYKRSNADANELRAQVKGGQTFERWRFWALKLNLDFIGFAAGSSPATPAIFISVPPAL
jgi:hypothetical protein